jgi:hypothetical protein
VWPGGAGYRLTCRLTVVAMGGYGLAWPSICACWLPVWLPGISLAGLMFEGLRPKAGLRASQASGPIRLSRTVLWRGLRRLGEVPVAASAARA